MSNERGTRKRRKRSKKSPKMNGNVTSFQENCRGPETRVQKVTESKLTSRAFGDVCEKLCEVERFIRLVETLVSAFVTAFLQLTVHSRERKVTG